MSEWDNINDVDGWKQKLDELLIEARQIAKEDDFEKRDAMSHRLMEFVKESRPNTDEVKMLDDIAAKVASDLMMETIEDRLSAITERTGAYHQATKEFEANAEENSAKADSIRLRAITSFIDSTTKTVEAAKELQKALQDNAGDVKLGEKIQATIDAIEQLRSSVGKRI